MFKKTLIITLLIGTFLFLGITGTIQADEYPDGPIDFIVAYSAGGGTDVTARAVATPLEDVLGVPVTVHNITGAGGEVGFTELAQNDPDGYTIGFINTPPVVSIPIERDADFTYEDFEPLVNIVLDPGAIAVPEDSPFETLDDLMEYAEENVVTYGTSGHGGDNHIATREIARDADVNFQHVPFDGAAEAITAALGQHTTAVSAKISELRHYHEDGLRVLAVAMDERHEDFPEIPTFEDAGYAAPLPWGSARGIAAPAGISEEQKEILIEGILEAMETERFEQSKEELALEMHVLVGDEYMDYLKSTEPIWRDAFEQYPW